MSNTNKKIKEGAELGLSGAEQLAEKTLGAKNLFTQLLKKANKVTQAISVIYAKDKVRAVTIIAGGALAVAALPLLVPSFATSSSVVFALGGLGASFLGSGITAFGYDQWKKFIGKDSDSDTDTVNKEKSTAISSAVNSVVSNDDSSGDDVSNHDFDVMQKQQESEIARWKERAKREKEQQAQQQQQASSSSSSSSSSSGSTGGATGGSSSDNDDHDYNGSPYPSGSGSSSSSSSNDDDYNDHDYDQDSNSHGSSSSSSSSSDSNSDYDDDWDDHDYNGMPDDSDSSSSSDDDDDYWWHDGYPIVLDLDGDGVELVDLKNSNIFFDINGDGYRNNMGWVKGDDAFLAIDINGDKKITDYRELSFKEWDSKAKTDLEGLKSFDTNQNGKLDSGDLHWAKFGVWQDSNQNGIAIPDNDNERNFMVG